MTVQQVGDETVVFNETTQQAICLNRVAATVWELCDGLRSREAIALAASDRMQDIVPIAVVDYAPGELRAKGLVAPCCD